MRWNRRSRQLPCRRARLPAQRRTRAAHPERQGTYERMTSELRNRLPLRTLRKNPWRLLAPFALVSASTPVWAQDYPSREVSGWTVAASTDKQGCFLTREYARSGETTLLLGIDIDGSNHLSVLNRNWSIKPKDRLKLSFRLTKGGYADHFAVGIVSDGKQGFVTNFDAKFPGHFAASKALQIYRGKVPVEQLSLEGSAAAITELRRCVELHRTSAKPAAAQNRSSRIPKDPFARD